MASLLPVAAAHQPGSCGVKKKIVRTQEASVRTAMTLLHQKEPTTGGGSVGDVSTSPPTSASPPTSTASGLFVLGEDIEPDMDAVEGTILKQALQNGTSVAVGMENGFDLSSVAPFLTRGYGSIIDDEFSRCFVESKARPWNFNAMLMPMWVFGVFIRYCVLLPLRLAVFIIGTLIVIPLVLLAPMVFKTPERCKKNQQKVIRMLCWVYVMSWTGVVLTHGKPPSGGNHVFVANHSSLADVIVLQVRQSLAMLGQEHTGFVGFFQNKILGCLDCLWFERKIKSQRSKVAQLITEHVEDANKAPLLIFPEGTCTNNRHIVMFKKGAFDLGVPVVPVGIRWNLDWAPAYWNSRRLSFLEYQMSMMKNWFVACDVFYMAPQHRREGETAMAFANRVRSMIACETGLTTVPWDGYLKYFKPSPRLKAYVQELFAQQMSLRASWDLPLQDNDMAAKIAEVKEAVGGAGGEVVDLQFTSPAHPPRSRSNSTDPVSLTLPPVAAPVSSPQDGHSDSSSDLDSGSAPVVAEAGLRKRNLPR